MLAEQLLAVGIFKLLVALLAVHHLESLHIGLSVGMCILGVELHAENAAILAHETLYLGTAALGYLQVALGHCCYEILVMLGQVQLLVVQFG